MLSREYCSAGKAPEVQGETIVGYAAIWNSPSEPQQTSKGTMRTIIQKGAFASALARADIIALVGHDDTMVLGRVSAGTLSLAEDEIGLRYTITPPDTSFGRDAKESIRRRDVIGSSFGFWTGPASKTQETFTKDEKSGEITRTIVEADLFEVSPVAIPLFPSTNGTVHVVGHDAHQKTLELRAKLLAL